MKIKLNNFDFQIKIQRTGFLPAYLDNFLRYLCVFVRSFVRYVIILFSVKACYIIHYGHI